MTIEELREYLITEHDKNFSGWDFSHLDGKMVEDPLPWNYRNLVSSAVAKPAQCMLDMGTGGGEFLDSLPVLPPATYATEGYPPNLEIARKRLQPKGIEVRKVLEDDLLPFEDAFFDLVINRHESFSCKEVYRVLQPDGVFLTQQVGGINDLDINAVLGANLPDYLDWCLFKAKDDLLNRGFEIVFSDEYLGKTRFYDIGTLVYYLKCIPWQIEDFSVDKYINRLFLLHQQIQNKGYWDFILQRFMIIARKPNN